jgi:hypothetical protein
MRRHGSDQRIAIRWRGAGFLKNRRNTRIEIRWSLDQRTPPARSESTRDRLP